MATHEKKRSEQNNPQSRETSKGDLTTPHRSALPARFGRPEPFPLRQIRDEFEHLFDRFLPAWPSFWEGRDRSDFWGLDVDEQDDSVLVRAEAPGFEPGDFDLQVRGNQLLLCASHQEESKESGEKERSYQWSQHALCRTVELPTDVSADKVEANYKNGVLTVKLPKATPSTSRRITVQG